MQPFTGRSVGSDAPALSGRRNYSVVKSQSDSFFALGIAGRLGQSERIVIGMLNKADPEKRHQSAPGVRSGVATLRQSAR